MTTRARLPWYFAVQLCCYVSDTNFLQPNTSNLLTFLNHSIFFFFLILIFHWNWSCGNDTIGVKSEQGDCASFGLLIFSSLSGVPFPLFAVNLFWALSTTLVLGFLCHRLEGGACSCVEGELKLDTSSGSCYSSIKFGLYAYQTFFVLKWLVGFASWLSVLFSKLSIIKWCFGLGLLRPTCHAYEELKAETGTCLHELEVRRVWLFFFSVVNSGVFRGWCWFDLLCMMSLARFCDGQ